MKYLSSVYGKGGIEAHCVAASIANGIPIYTLETKAPKFIDAECLVGDTLLHFERQANPHQQCLATMSIEEFHDKWVNGIEKVSKLGNVFRNKYKNILRKMRLRCYDFETEKYTTTSVVDIWQSGVKKVYRIVCGDFDIEASENHYFLTQRGWVQVKNLRLNDSLVRISHRGKKQVPKNYLSFNRAIKPELLELQDFKCKDCSCEININCDVHHVIPVTVEPDLWNNKDNVIALCQDCHTNRHTKLGYTSLSPALSGITSIEYAGEKMTYDLQVEHNDSNFVANGFVVHNCEKHRMLSSNSSSSRAIPFKYLEQIYLPFDIRENQKGMQGYENINQEDNNNFISDLNYIKFINEEIILKWKDRIHKQHLNRYLEPWMFQKKVVTATEWDNFFRLRLAPDAQPEIQELAKCMKSAIDQAEPTVLTSGQWHLPYVSSSDVDWSDFKGFINGEDLKRKCSAARCARVSYNNHDNSSPSVEKDLALAELLLSSKHLTPFEHVLSPMKRINICDLNDLRITEEGISHVDKYGNLWSGNMRGWIQFRKIVE